MLAWRATAQCTKVPRTSIYGQLGSVRDLCLALWLVIVIHKRNHRYLSKRFTAIMWLGRSHICVHHRQAVSQLQVLHSIKTPFLIFWIWARTGLETDIGTRTQAGLPRSPLSRLKSQRNIVYETSITAERNQKSEVVDYLLWQRRRHRQHAGDLLYDPKSTFTTTGCRCTRWFFPTTRSTHEFLASPAFSPGSTSTAGGTPPSTRRLPRASTMALARSRTSLLLSSSLF